MRRAQVLRTGIACALLSGVVVASVTVHGQASVRTTSVELPTAAHEDPHEQIRTLLAKVEQRMREIDRLLADAAAGGAAKQRQADATGIGTLLQVSGERAQQTVEDIDRILELANHPHPPGGT